MNLEANLLKTIKSASLNLADLKYIVIVLNCQKYAINIAHITSV